MNEDGFRDSYAASAPGGLITPDKDGGNDSRHRDHVRSRGAYRAAEAMVELGDTPCIETS